MTNWQQIGQPTITAFLIIVYFLFQQPINAIYAQSPEDIEKALKEAKEKISEAQQQAYQVPLGTVSILSNSSYTDSAGILRVVGEVYNDMTPYTAGDVQVIATFYDSNNTVVGTNSTFTTPRNIASGEKAPFDLKMSSASISIEEIDHYDLKVDWK